MSHQRVPRLHGSLRRRSVEHHGLRVTEGWLPADADRGVHRHERPGFGVVLDGAMNIAFRSRAREGLPGCFGAEAPDDPHRDRFGHEGAHIVAFEFSPERIAACGEGARFVLGGEARRDAAVIPLARRASVELRAPDAASGLILESTMLEILALALRRDAGGTGRRAPVWFEQALALLHARFLEPLGADEVAAAVHVHPMHLTRVFRDRLRTSPGLYVRGLRLDWAARRLVETDEPVAQIALDAGFADQSHFTRRFRERTGVTPGRYRSTRRA